MRSKVVLISIDGMRPDGVLQCNNPYVEELKNLCAYSFDARTVYPSVTLPCHMSMFHSIPPERHGITTNIYTPPVRPVNGLFEQLKNADKKSAFFYGWEPLRDIARPETLVQAEFIYQNMFEHTDAILTDRALSYIHAVKPDFVFLYMGETDEKGGHGFGWMSDTYFDYLSRAISNVKKVVEETKEEYTVIITADHGGHDRGHGSDIPEDMTIPIFCYGPQFTPGKIRGDVSILDIAPTIAEIIGVSPAKEWEGKSLLQVQNK